MTLPLAATIQSIPYSGQTGHLVELGLALVISIDEPQPTAGEEQKATANELEPTRCCKRKPYYGLMMLSDDDLMKHGDGPQMMHER